MFQNIVDLEKEENIKIEQITIDKKYRIKQMIKKLFTKQNILMYIIALMLSTVSGINGMAPFGLAIFAAAISNALPARNNICSNTYRNWTGVWWELCVNIYINIFSIYCNGINI